MLLNRVDLNVLNTTFIDKAKIRIYDILRAFIMIILLVKANILEDTLGCNLKNIINYDITKHIVLYVIILITVDTGTPDEITPINNITNAFILWIIFLLFSKMDLKIIYAILFLLVVVYLMDSFDKYYEKNNKKEKKYTSKLIIITEYCIIITYIIGVIRVLLYTDKYKLSQILNLKC